MKSDTILVTGATGQIGTVLVAELRKIYGENAVVQSDIRKPEKEDGPFELLDVRNKEKVDEIINKHSITQVYHLAAILSAKGEQNPRETWNINMDGLFNIFDSSLENNVKKIFFPSSIAVFGNDTPKEDTPQNTILVPSTVYGISKAAGELWANYYYMRYGLDIRCLRYPGIISYQSMPGGGTTDYAVEIYHKAVKGERFSCFLKPHTRLPMMYMPDAIRATIELMDAPEKNISIRTAYNLSGMSFTPEEIATEIKKRVFNFEIDYQPDPLRQSIAESWPATIDDSKAKTDWGWSPQYNLATMTQEMLYQLEKLYTTEKVH